MSDPRTPPRQTAGEALVRACPRPASGTAPSLPGAALVDPAQVDAVEVENLDGRVFVRTPNT